MPSTSLSLSWQDCWLTSNQQAAKLLTQHQFKRAAAKFTNSQWQGVAYYRTQNYLAAANAFAQENSPTANYNRGNALAFLGKYKEAIAAYNAALKQDPNFADAVYNKKIIEHLEQQPRIQTTSMSSTSNPNHSNKSQLKNKQFANSQFQLQQRIRASIQDHSSKNQQRQLSAQQQQNITQWLQQIPDDPSELLRRKFLRDYQAAHNLTPM